MLTVNLNHVCILIDKWKQISAQMKSQIVNLSLELFWSESVKARTIVAFLKGCSRSLAGVPSVESFPGNVSLALPDSIAARLGAGAPSLPFGPLAVH